MSARVRVRARVRARVRVRVRARVRLATIHPCAVGRYHPGRTCTGATFDPYI